MHVLINQPDTAPRMQRHVAVRVAIVIDVWIDLIFSLLSDRTFWVGSLILAMPLDRSLQRFSHSERLGTYATLSTRRH